MIEEGADVVDVGGVKAGPGDSVDVDEEIARVVPFIEWLRDTFPDQLISVDTWRSAVAKQACAAGAGLINDTWGGHDPGLAEVAAEFGAGLGVLASRRCDAADTTVSRQLRHHGARCGRRCDRRGDRRRRARGEPSVWTVMRC